MRLTSFFIPTLKENPVEATIVSHRLMLRAGMIRQLAAGIYTWLPLGLRVLKKVEGIIRQEMDRAGCNEILMSTIQPARLWQESGRYDGYGKEMLRMVDRHEQPMLYGPTNEEVVTDICRQSMQSYRDCPQILYQIQWKFRDEIRPRFGVMRGREFLMKDAYSLDIDATSAKRSYELMMRTYIRTFAAMGLTAIPVRANTGPIGGDLSHEFHIVADTGESAIYFDEAFTKLRPGEDVDLEQLLSWYSAADERHDPATCPVPAERLQTRRGIEVGHIFYFGTKYSEAMGATVTDQHGKQVPLEMGSYGIGVSRLVGGIIEASHDEAGMIWPDAVAPFIVHLVQLQPNNTFAAAASENMYNALIAAGVEVLWDNTDTQTGTKFATADLLGCPWQCIIGPKNAEQNMVELKRRATGERQLLSTEAALSLLSTPFEQK
jgi:prolyl-tRNA synthetase